MLNKIKNYFSNLIDDVRQFSDSHPAITGFTVASIVLYVTAVLASIITGKKWYLE